MKQNQVNQVAPWFVPLAHVTYVDKSVNGIALAHWHGGAMPCPTTSKQEGLIPAWVWCFGVLVSSTKNHIIKALLMWLPTAPGCPGRKGSWIWRKQRSACEWRFGNVWKHLSVCLSSYTQRGQTSFCNFLKCSLKVKLHNRIITRIKYKHIYVKH